MCDEQKWSGWTQELPISDAKQELKDVGVTQHNTIDRENGCGNIRRHGSYRTGEKTFLLNQPTPHVSFSQHFSTSCFSRAVVVLRTGPCTTSSVVRLRLFLQFCHITSCANPTLSPSAEPLLSNKLPRIAKGLTVKRVVDKVNVKNVCVDFSRRSFFPVFFQPVFNPF